MKIEIKPVPYQGADVFSRGWADALSGIAFEENPMDNDTDRYLWEAGWKECAMENDFDDEFELFPLDT